MITPGEKKFLCFFPNKTSRKNRWVSAPGHCFCFVSIKHSHRRGMNDSIYYLHRHNHEYNATVAVIIITVIRSESASTSCIEGDDIFSNDINSQLVDTLTRALLFPHTLSHISTLTRLDNNADDLNWWHARMHTNRQMLIQTRTLHHTADSSTHTCTHTHFQMSGDDSFGLLKAQQESLQDTDSFPVAEVKCGRCSIVFWLFILNMLCFQWEGCQYLFACTQLRAMVPSVNILLIKIQKNTTN